MRTTAGQQRWALARRRTWVSGFFGLAGWLGWWWATPLIVFGVFVAVVTATHDVVHRTLGLTDRQTDIWLFLSGLVLLLESGHAYQATHRQHHQDLFPARTTPKAIQPTCRSSARWRPRPIFLIRLWIWAFAEPTGEGDATAGGGGDGAGGGGRRWRGAPRGDPGVARLRGDGDSRQLGLSTVDGVPTAPRLR